MHTRCKCKVCITSCMSRNIYSCLIWFVLISRTRSSFGEMWRGDRYCLYGDWYVPHFLTRFSLNWKLDYPKSKGHLKGVWKRIADRRDSSRRILNFSMQDKSCRLDADSLRSSAWRTCRKSDLHPTNDEITRANRHRSVICWFALVRAITRIRSPDRWMETFLLDRSIIRHVRPLTLMFTSVLIFHALVGSRTSRSSLDRFLLLSRFSFWFSPCRTSKSSPIWTRSCEAIGSVGIKSRPWTEFVNRGSFQRSLHRVCCRD